ncbi:uncharacterized protein LOC129129144 isoform X1 [Agelaius phoeniceus]|uniref:uncharacterized protein LOC129129144 isoform X1 n=1 Tax=Agelaius phoeniceus TaxID=39638 RepID=UPI004054B110
MCTRPEGKNGNSQISSAGHDMKWKWVSLIMGFKESKFSTAAAFTNSRFGDLRLNSSWNSWKMDAENFLGVFSPVYIYMCLLKYLESRNEVGSSLMISQYFLVLLIFQAVSGGVM